MTEGSSARRVNRTILLIGALLGGTGVIAGAFGAHALRATLSAEALGWWQTAAQYQLLHAVALVAIAALSWPNKGWPATLIALGTMIFATTLYVMALTGLRWLGAVTPLGGTLMIAGWLLLAFRASRGQFF